MKRRIFNAIAVVSAVLCVGIVALFVRSFTTADKLLWLSPDHHAGMSSGNGIILVMFGPNVKQRNALPPGWLYRNYSATGGAVRVMISSSKYRRFGWLGFAYDPMVTGIQAPQQHFNLSNMIFFPHWGLVIILGIIPGMWAREWLLQRERNRAGLCRKCGYDLRATPDRCPECGSVPAGAMTKSQ